MTPLPRDDLPMSAMLEQGIRDLEVGDTDTEAALLMRIGAPRLTEVGVTALLPFLDGSDTTLELQLFAAIRRRTHSRDAAFSRYKALTTELASLESAATVRARRLGLLG